MKYPQDFLTWKCPNVLPTGMIMNCILFAAIGFFGYVRYGDNVKANIVLNLPAGHWLSQTAQMLIAIVIWFSFGLQFYPTTETLFKKIGHRIPAVRMNMAQILIRSGICLILGVLVMVIPDLRPLIGLIGSVFFSLLGKLCEDIFLSAKFDLLNKDLKFSFSSHCRSSYSESNRNHFYLAEFR